MPITRLIYDPNADYMGDPNDENSNMDNFNVDPGKTHVVLDAKGPGVVTHIWFTFLSPEPQMWAEKGAANHQEMLLRIYYDGNPRPAVEAPFGDFFANCFGRRSEVISLPVCVEDGDAYNCFWRMPFRKSINIEIVNESEKQIRLLYYNVDWVKKDKISDDTPYFYAQYKQEYPVEQGKDYLILETEGKGHYVGTVLAVRTRSPAWFGEGDEKVYIDGEKKPSIWGTGTEDYFLSAFGLKKCSFPYFGVALFRPVGNHRQPHQRLPLAPQRSDHLQQEHQVHHRAFGLDVGGRKPEGRAKQLERAAGRLFERRLLVSNRHADVQGPGAARPRAETAESRPRDRAGQGLFGPPASWPRPSKAANAGRVLSAAADALSPGPHGRRLGGDARRSEGQGAATAA